MINRIYLDEHFVLFCELEQLKVVLAISQGDKELACRREKLAKLKAFISNNDGSIFKGRLQLHKTANEINVLLKSKSIGKIAVFDFEQILNNLHE